MVTYMSKTLNGRIESEEKVRLSRSNLFIVMVHKIIR